MTSLKELAEIILSLKDSPLLLASHINPDADAYGSAIALTRVLSLNGFDVVFYPGEKCENNIAWFKDLSKDVRHEIDNKRRVIALDTANIEIINLPEDIKLDDAIVIDHHISNAGWGEINYVQGERSSTCAIIFELTKELGFDVDKETATLLLAGLIQDTGSFRYSNTGAVDLAIAAELVKHGADISDISNKLYYSQSLKKTRLKGLVIHNLKVEKDIAYSFISQQDLKNLDMQEGDADGVIDLVRNIEGIRACFYLRPDGEKFKVSLRSKSSDTDVNKVAQAFGGGGHKEAAGLRIKEDLDTAISLILKEFS